jgi:hypothetical protein
LRERFDGSGIGGAARSAGVAGFGAASAGGLGAVGLASGSRGFCQVGRALDLLPLPLAQQACSEQACSDSFQVGGRFRWHLSAVLLYRGRSLRPLFLRNSPSPSMPVLLLPWPRRRGHEKRSCDAFWVSGCSRRRIRSLGCTRIEADAC